MPFSPSCSTSEMRYWWGCTLFWQCIEGQSLIAYLHYGHPQSGVYVGSALHVPMVYGTITPKTILCHGNNAY